MEKPASEQVNVVKELYDSLEVIDISKKIAEMVKPKNVRFEFDILYQSIENLHQACPNDLGDWYFSGDYPTPGGNKVANQAFINYYEGKNVRAY